MLNKKQKYLQIALNSTITEAELIINQLPKDERIIIEVGTPLIKRYGVEAIKKIKSLWSSYLLKEFLLKELNIHQDFKKFYPYIVADLETMNRDATEIEVVLEEEISHLKEFNITKDFKKFHPYVVADLKTMDRGATEVEIAFEGGANAAIVLGTAPIETINTFIEKCKELKMDSMVDMMNIDFSLEILRKLKTLPDVVILHRGVDEENLNPESEIPYHEIQRIKENYDILVAIAGGDTLHEIQRALFNDADIIIVWKNFYKSSSEITNLAKKILKEIR